MTEHVQWLPVPGYEGIYLASSAGEVYSLARRQADGRIRAGMLLRQSRDGKGYWRVVLTAADGARATVRVHDVIALTFHGPKPAGKQVRHWNGDQNQNHQGNLRYGTQSQNERDKRLRSRRLRREQKNRKNVTNVTSATPYWVLSAVTGLRGRP